MKDRMKKGSLSVEAVFIVPVCVMVCFFLLGSLFYLYHAGYYGFAAWECVLTGVDESPGAESIENRWQYLKGEQTMPVGSVQMSDKKSKSQIKVEIKGSSIHFWGFSKQIFSAEAKKRVRSPAAFVRKSKCAKSIGKEG